MNTQSNVAITLETILSALTKVEKANGTELDSLKLALSSVPTKAVDLFHSVAKSESIDDRFKCLLEYCSQDTNEAKYLLEASLLM
ncbi:hypothetical protein [Vibrio maerlii]|uniref:hypothetical protein n=1 Tax=Vibrio maerlii TaxID=2231648 RepID=UPI000E3CB0C2|nr:hypothetical protein [Vibrio maerlii]